MMICPRCNTPVAAGNRYCTSCGADLSASAAPAAGGYQAAGGPAPVKVKVVKSAPRTAGAAPASTIRVPTPGNCYYHQNLVATHVCGRCGRSVCTDCAKNHGGITFCTECAGRMPGVSGPIAGARTNGLAIASLILGILGVPILPIIFGFIARKQIAESGGAQQGDGMALWGIILGFAFIGFLALLVIIGISAASL